MTVCTYCGKDNSQPGAVYCQSCGSRLDQQSQKTPGAMATSSPMTTTSSSSYGTAGGSGYTSSSDFSERYEQALRSVERMAKIVIILAIVTLVLVI
jgi:uncharacterized membrane protein YvbJ